MRKQMREQRIKEDQTQKLSERKESGDRLVEKWSRKKDIGDGIDKIYEGNSDKARGLSFILENQERHLTSLTETQISNAFQTAPNNVIKIV